MSRLIAYVRPFVIGVAAAMLAGVAVPAMAQTGAGPQPGDTAWPIGIRAGIARDPNQVFFGGQIETPGLTQGGHLTFRPSAVVGAGSDVVLFNANFDVLYYARIPESSWTLYFGGGPALNIMHQSFEGEGGLTTVLGGDNVVVGMQNARGLFFEYRASGGIGHSLQATVGFVLAR